MINLKQWIKKNKQLKIHGDVEIGGNGVIVGSGVLRLNVCWHNSKRQFGCLFNDGIIEVSNKFEIYKECDISIRKEATLILGSGYINKRATIDCKRRIEIGNNVRIGPEVMIRDYSDEVLVGGRKKEGVKIGDGVWIGARVTILPGVEIGEGSVIGAGTILAKSIPKKSLVIGAKQLVIRENIEWI